MSLALPVFVYEDIIADLESSPIIEKSGYKYFLSPISNGLPPMKASMISDVLDWMMSVGNLDCDLILAPEAMGIPYATALTLKTGIPMSVIRKSPTTLDGEIEILQRTGYSKSKMYINGLKEGMKVVIIDDVVSTGGTMKAIISAVLDAGVTISDILVVINKDGGASKVANDVGIKPKTMVDITVTKDNKVQAALSKN